jgi:hypothetical protein
MKKGYFVDFSSSTPVATTLYADAEGDLAASEKFNHVFCGENTTAGAQCPNCALPLLQILKLDMSDPRLAEVATPSGSFPFLYCWRCDIVVDTLYYKLNGDGSVTVVEYAKGSDEGLGDDYPESFPAARATLLEMSGEASAYIKKLNEDEAFDDSDYDDDVAALDRCVHQIGGEPYLVNGDTYGPVICPSCGGAMPLLASLGTKCTDPRGMLITEINNYVQVIYHYCAPCSMVAALNEED